MKDHTTILVAYTDYKDAHKHWFEKVYYKSYPNYDDMPDICKSEDTRKEWEDYWRERNSE